MIATIVYFKCTFIYNIHFDTFNTITNESFFTFTCEFIVDLKTICVQMTGPATFVPVSMPLIRDGTVYEP